MAQSAQIKKVNSWHERLCDWLIANPSSPHKEAAKEFGVTPAWISTVIHSDAFQDYYKERSAAVSDAVLHHVKDKMLGAADLATSEIQRRLETPQAIPMQDLLSITDVMTKRAMPAAPAPQAVQQNVFMLSKDDLAAARAAMRNRVEGQASGALPAPPAAIATSDKELELEAVEIVTDGGND